MPPWMFKWQTADEVPKINTKVKDKLAADCSWYHFAEPVIN